MCDQIIKNISHKCSIFESFNSSECIDIKQIIDICKLYNSKSSATSSIHLSEIQLNTPDFKKIKSKDNRSRKKDSSILKSSEFIKKYDFFIRALYSCLVLNVEVFDVCTDSFSLKNNYQLIKALETTKKSLINEHMTILKTLHKQNPSITPHYEAYNKNYITSLKIIDKLIQNINSLINKKFIEKTDTLLSLIIPYFYIQTEFIEEYN